VTRVWGPRQDEELPIEGELSSTCLTYDRVH
jgi:hypothetical protein